VDGCHGCRAYCWTCEDDRLSAYITTTGIYWKICAEDSVLFATVTQLSDDL